MFFISLALSVRPDSQPAVESKANKQSKRQNRALMSLSIAKQPSSGNGLCARQALSAQGLCAYWRPCYHRPMTKDQYSEFGKIRDEFRAYAASLSQRTPWLGPLQEKLRLALGYDDYRIETPVVYNEALDDIGLAAEPRFIVVADNPGKNEQKAANRRYLVGQSGKLAQSWFRAEMNMDFRSACLIINKTPIHTPKTAELSVLRRLAQAESPRRAQELDALLTESQKFMAGLAFRLHSGLGGILWVSGYGELKPKGLFSVWAGELSALYRGAAPSLRESVWVFRHFSMNQFAIEYKQAAKSAEAEAQAGKRADAPMGAGVSARLAAIGTANRKRILGW